MYCIETRGLTHRFSPHDIALDQIELKVPQGSIYGFLGPNGAGKTTTLRLLLGLLKKQQGEIFFFGQPFHRHRVEILKQTGTLIESPSLYGQLTAYENLKVLQTIYRCPEQRIRETLEIVGLAQTGKKKAARFSLGMKQHLSIAVALLHQPSLLLLDEPTNGLDPGGIIEVRELLKQLNRTQNMTIVISSHLLAEIEKMVTHVGIIHKGAMKFQGAMPELDALQTQANVQFRTSDHVRTMEIFREHRFTPAWENEMVSIPAVDEKRIAALNRQLVNSGIDVYHVSTTKRDLESVFTQLIQD